MCTGLIHVQLNSHSWEHEPLVQVEVGIILLILSIMTLNGYMYVYVHYRVILNLPGCIEHYQLIKVIIHQKYGTLYWFVCYLKNNQRYYVNDAQVQCICENIDLQWNLNHTHPKWQRISVKVLQLYNLCRIFSHLVWHIYLVYMDFRYSIFWRQLMALICTLVWDNYNLSLGIASGVALTHSNSPCLSLSCRSFWYSIAVSHAQ